MRMRAGLLALVASAGAAAAASLPVVPYPRDYQTTLVRYAVVDRVDGFSRDLYVSRDALEAVRRDPKLRGFPAGALFALDVHRAKQTGRDRRSGAPIFATSPDGHLDRSQDEHTLHLMQKIAPGFGSQNWAFGGFDPLTGVPLKLELPGDCLLCHQAALASDMAFSLTLLKRFAETGVVQYRSCGQPGRQVCPF